MLYVSRNSKRKGLPGWGQFLCLCAVVLCMASAAGAADSPLFGRNPFIHEDIARLGQTGVPFISDNEIFMLLIALVVIVEIGVNYRYLRPIRHRRVLLTGFAMVVLSAFSTVFEALFLPRFLNGLEHFSFMVSMILLAVWCGLVFGSKREESA